MPLPFRCLFGSEVWCLFNLGAGIASSAGAVIAASRTSTVVSLGLLAVGLSASAAIPTSPSSIKSSRAETITMARLNGCSSILWRLDPLPACLLRNGSRDIRICRQQAFCHNHCMSNTLRPMCWPSGLMISGFCTGSWRIWP